jgi:hypothetical protein
VPTLNHAGAAMGYEIAHVHLADNSLHMYLSPLDARAVIESEWGERFPVKELGPPGWVSTISRASCMLATAHYCREPS